MRKDKRDNGFLTGWMFIGITRFFAAQPSNRRLLQIPNVHSFITYDTVNLHESNTTLFPAQTKLKQHSTKPATTYSWLH